MELGIILLLLGQSIVLSIRHAMLKAKVEELEKRIGQQIQAKEE